MKKTVLLVMVALLAVLLVACGTADKKSSPDSDDPGVSDDTTKDPDEKPDDTVCLHETVTDAAVEATCTEAGKTEGSHCAKCQKVLKAQEEIPAAGHVWKEATCSAPKTCTGCDLTEGEAVDHKYQNGVCTFCKQKQPAEIAFFYDTLTLTEGDEPYIDVDDLYAWLSGKGSVSFVSDSPAVFTVKGSGYITPVAPGSGKLIATATSGDYEKIHEIAITVKEMWKPTDPVSKEVVDIMRNKQLANATTAFFTGEEFNGSEWDTREDKTKTERGPVSIWQGHLSINIMIAKMEIDAVAGRLTDDTNYSFTVYLREKNMEDDRTLYSKVEGALTPWHINTGYNVICRCPFYENTNLVELVEEGKTYEFVIVVSEGEEMLAWGKTDAKWTDACTLYIEAAEKNPSVVK